MAIALDKKVESFYVADAIRHDIQKFDASSGKFILKFGKKAAVKENLRPLQV